MAFVIGTLSPDEIGPILGIPIPDFNTTDDADQIYGGHGADNICAQGGNDKIYGGAGSDLIDGGDGDDLIFGGRLNAPGQPVKGIGSRPAPAMTSSSAIKATTRCSASSATTRSTAAPATTSSSATIRGRAAMM
jgi:hypothetical protein